jgi:hypothetical protein
MKEKNDLVLGWVRRAGSDLVAMDASLKVAHWTRHAFTLSKLLRILSCVLDPTRYSRLQLLRLILSVPTQFALRLTF